MLHIDSTAAAPAARAEAAGPEASDPASPARRLETFRQSMRRFADLYANLPVATQATCPTCRPLVSAQFARHKAQVVLEYACPTCGPRQEVHADAIWGTATSERPHSP